MKISNIIVAVLLLAALVPASTCFASPESKRAAIEEMLTLSKADQIIETMYGQVEGLLQRQFQQLGATADEKPILDKFSKDVLQIMREEMSWDKMKGDFVTVYDKVYTEEDITAINKFYKSPAGRKMLAKMPELMQASMAIPQKYLQNILPRLQKLSQEMAKEIKEHKAAAPAGS